MPKQDVVNPEWLTRHHVTIPRATGFFESETAWVKTDHTGAIIEAGEKDQSALAYLIAREILDHYHAQYAMMFQDMHQCFFRKYGYAALSTYTLEFFSSFSVDQLDEVYERVCNDIGKKQVRAILFVTVTPVSTVGIVAKLNAHHREYRTAFDHLAQAIDRHTPKKSLR